MKIETGTNLLHIGQRAQASSAERSGRASFASVLAAATAGTSGAPASKQADFTNMTRQEMFDWMNDQIRSGKMSLDESTPFLGMTMSVSATTGQAIDMATDTTRINFVEKARLGIEGALSRNDPDLARRLEAAIGLMQRQQGQALGVNVRA